MKFYISTPELDQQIAEIKRKMRLSMNGVVSDQMKKNGIQYKINFGVAIPRIREIAKEYTPNHDLAQRLWMLQIRETMILASLLEPAEKFSPTDAKKWAESFNQIEIIEQTCMNLLAKLDFAPQLMMEWIQSDNQWLKIAGYILGARIFSKIPASAAVEVTNIALGEAKSENLQMYRSIAICLSRFCRIDKNTASYILKATEGLEDGISSGERYISNEVKQEIFFLDIL
jgi:3-methyladenine DNA glycosylase AlkD